MTLREKVKVLLFVAGFLLLILLAASLLIYIHPSLFWFANGLFIGVAGTAERVMPKWEAEITQEIEVRYQAKETEDERRRQRAESNHLERDA
jgi:hypothetical protein